MPIPALKKIVVEPSGFAEWFLQLIPQLQSKQRLELTSRVAQLGVSPVGKTEEIPLSKHGVTAAIKDGKFEFGFSKLDNVESAYKFGMDILPVLSDGERKKIWDALYSTPSAS